MNESTVKVSSIRVTNVNAVRSLRRFMLEIPSWKAASEAPERFTSVWWMTATSVRSCLMLSLKRPLTITMTNTAMVPMMKANRMPKGLEISNAGWTMERMTQMAMKMPTKPKIWFLIVAAVISKRSAKNAHGMSSARKKTMP